MASWFFACRKKVLAEADELMEYYGDGAYYAARKMAKEARAKGERRQAAGAILYSRGRAHREIH